MKSTWHEFFLDNLTLPNLLSAFRLLLTPVFILLFLRVQTPAQYYYTVTLAAILALSDLADGWIARRYHQVTDLGKFLDPLSDKLLQAALLFCLGTRYPLVWVLSGVFVLKEGALALAALLLLRQTGRKLDGAKWWGKCSTALLYAALFLLLAFPRLSPAVVQALLYLCMAALFASGVLYALLYRRLWRR